VAAENQMPLAPMVLAFASEQADGFAVRAASLARRLNEGASLGEAVAQSRGVLPPEAPLAVRLGEVSGDLPSSLRATNLDAAFDRTLIPAIVLRALYIVPAMLIFVAYMNLRAAPSMAGIFRDFDVPLPAISVAVMNSPALRTSNVVATVTLVILATALCWILAWLQWRGTLVPRLPVIKRIANWIDGGSVLRVLTLAARKQVPLPKVFWALARLHPKRSVRGRMRRAAQQVDDGRPWPESLRRQRLLGGRDVAALSAAERNGNLDWALAQMAESYERRANYRLQAILQSAVPLAIVPIGFVVGVVAVAYFAPLARLIWQLSF
jgi:protein transport protein HofC